MDRKMLIAAIVIIIAVIGLGAYVYSNTSSSSNKTVLTIYHAGSLSALMNSTAKKFEQEHPNVDVRLEPYGSAEAIKQVTELNKSGDIVASADYGLIDKRMFPNYATWNLQFARNELVIAYTDKSKYNAEINGSNWYQIFRKEGVTYGFSDPNTDPCGYRAVMMMQLANSYYNDSNIFQDLIVNNTDITSKQNGTGWIINCPTNINPSSKVISRPKEVDLMSSLESGSLDYLIIYKNAAEQQKSSGVKYVTLPDELNLKDTQYESTYKKISLVQNSGTNKTKTVKLSPIVYGITVVKNSAHYDLAVEFVKLLISSEGTKLINESYQEPITPAIATKNSTNIPSALQQYITQATG